MFCAILALLVIFRAPPEGIPFGRLPGIGPAVLIVLSIVILRRILGASGLWVRPSDSITAA
jgi:hypothetical protein